MGFADQREVQNALMEEGAQDAVEARLLEVEPVVRGIVRQKLRVSLSRSDHREANLDGLDVLGEVHLKLLRVLQRTDEAAVATDFRCYAATVTYHSCADYLRSRYPKRASLKNCLRRLLDKATTLDIWRVSSGEMICGFAGHRGEDARDGTAIRKFERQMAVSPALSTPGIASERWSVPEWLNLLESIFRMVGSAMTLDDLIAIVGPLSGAEDLRETHEQVRDNEDDTPVAGVELLSSHDPSPQAVLMSKDRLRLFWAAVLQLLPWHRAALLLNMRDGDLDALPYYGVASVEDIGRCLELKPPQLKALEGALGLAHSPGQTANERFAACWRFLPLEDEMLAAVLGVTRSQVIGYRSKARERLTRSLGSAL